MLTVLLNKKFNNIHRAIDMLMLDFGKTSERTFISGKAKLFPEFSLHVQTQWRFREQGTILLASSDIYEPFNENVSENWTYDNIGLPDDESSVFEVIAKSFRLKMQEAFVVACNLSETGDIRLDFSNGVIFELFISTSLKDENWRLIDYKHNIHTICFDESGAISSD